MAWLGSLSSHLIGVRQPVRCFIYSFRLSFLFTASKQFQRRLCQVPSQTAEFYLSTVDRAFLKIDLSGAREGLAFPFATSWSLVAAGRSTCLTAALSTTYLKHLEYLWMTTPAITVPGILWSFTAFLTAHSVFRSCSSIWDPVAPPKHSTYPCVPAPLLSAAA